MKSEVEVMAGRPEEDESEDEEGGEVEVETDAERLRAEKADGYFGWRTRENPRSRR